MPKTGDDKWHRPEYAGGGKIKGPSFESPFFGTFAIARTTVTCGLYSNGPGGFTVSRSKKLITTSLISMAVAAGLCLPDAVQANQDGAPRKVAAADQSLTITGFTDGIHRDKYVVSVPGVGNTWFSQTGSHSTGAGESGLRTTKAEWCRVRYLVKV